MSSGAAELIAALLENLGPALKHALGTFVRTTVGMAFLAILLVGLSYSIAAQGDPRRGFIAVLATLLLCAMGGALLAMKRAVATGVIHAIEAMGVGAKGIEVLFESLLQLQAEDKHADRGAALAKAAENLPLVEAEARLKSAVSHIVTAPDAGGGSAGWVKRKMVGAIFEKIEQITLDEFRREDQTGSGVDLVLVQNRLGNKVDHLLMDMSAAAARKITLLVITGLMVGTLLLAYGISQVQI